VSTSCPRGEEALVTVSYAASSVRSPSGQQFSLQLTVLDPTIVSIVGDHMVRCEFEGSDDDNVTSNCSFVLRGLFLGRTVIHIMDVTNNTFELDPPAIIPQRPTIVGEYHVSVIRKERIIDHVFLGLVTLMVIFANVGMGCKIELSVVKEVLMKPIAPAIGFFCQYLIMPLVSFFTMNV
jgi:hypothetical protein